MGNSYGRTPGLAITVVLGWSLLLQAIPLQVRASDEAPVRPAKTPVAAAETAMPEAAAVFQDKTGLSVEAVFADWREDAAHQARDYYVWGLAHYTRLHFHHAIAAANRALVISRTADEKVACYALLAQGYGGLGEYPLAAQAALNGQRLKPDSLEIGRLRVAFCELAGDDLASAAAKAHLRKIDPVFDRNPKCEPITIIVAGAVLTVAIICATTYAMHRDLLPLVREQMNGMPPESRATVLRQLIDAHKDTVTALLGFGSRAYGPLAVTAVRP